MKVISFKTVCIGFLVLLLSACGTRHIGTAQGENPYPDGGPAGSTVASDTENESSTDTNGNDNSGSNPDQGNQPDNGPADNGPGDNNDPGEDDEDIDEAIDEELGEGFDDDDFGDDFDEDLEGLDSGSEGGCGFPYMCVADAGECASFWEGTPVSSETCGDGGVCCDPFSSDGGDESEETTETAPPANNPITRDRFCSKILECVMPEGASVQDCDDVYDDAYCGNWDYYLGCMADCMDVECSEEDFGTDFVLCEGGCFDSYCG